MAWTKLADRLTQRPQLLAGPLLRRVTGDTVTVWVATRTGARVTLSVKNNVGVELMTGNRHTVAVGANLHIVAVTAFKKPVFTDLSEGIIYRYDLTFDFDGGPANQSLAAASQNFPFTYGSFASPTFAFPPKDLNSVRLMQGSCRMPHGSGYDNLFLLDVLIEQSAENPLTRPHHLLLTGDQIYADDVPDILLIMLSEASNALLGWQEILPVNKDHGGPKPAHNFSPYLRGKTLQDAGFTSDDVKSHLLSVGEYLAMYLFAWSEVCWAPELPTYDDVVENVKGNVDSRVFKHWKKFLESKEEGINADIKDVKQFRDVLPKVRRALANIPSSMIFDDHEITDDWNMTKSFCKDVYSDSLGKRVIMNGLVGYALCQHWGNVPEEFEDSTQSPAGLKLLRLLDKGNATTYEQSETQLRRIVSVHDWSEQKLKPDFGLFHDQDTPISIRGKKLFADSLTYNYSVEMPAYLVIMTDTRSWRSFPHGNDATPDLIPKNQFTPQIVNTPKLGNRLLLVVLTTNMPPVESIRHATRHSSMSTTLGKSDHPDLYEAWELPSEPFDRLVVKLTDKLDADSSGVIKGQIIVLSGDVHHSFASRLMYRAKKRFEDLEAQPAAVVFAQLVSSSLKKQNGDTVSMHDEGYKYGPTGAAWLVPRHAPEGYAGFLLPKGTQVGEFLASEMFGIPPQQLWVPLKLDQPTVQFKGATFDPDEKKVKLTKSPDYRYRLDYLNANVERVPPTTLPKIPPLPSGATADQRKQATEVFNKATGNYRVYNRGSKVERQMVGLNNISEITFDWGAEKRVHHTIRWIRIHPAFFFTTVTVSLDPDDRDFADITALKEP